VGSGGPVRSGIPNEIMKNRAYLFDDLFS